MHPPSCVVRYHVFSHAAGTHEDYYTVDEVNERCEGFRQGYAEGASASDSSREMLAIHR